MWPACLIRKVWSAQHEARSRSANVEVVLTISECDCQSANFECEFRSPTVVQSHQRLFAKAVWNELKETGSIPTTWGGVDAEVASKYQSKMCLRFPELALCEHGWKSQQFATDNYPNWFVLHGHGHGVRPSSTGNDVVAPPSVVGLQTDTLALTV